MTESSLTKQQKRMINYSVIVLTAVTFVLTYELINYLFGDEVSFFGSLGIAGVVLIAAFVYNLKSLIYGLMLPFLILFSLFTLSQVSLDLIIIALLLIGILSFLMLLFFIGTIFNFFVIFLVRLKKYRTLFLTTNFVFFLSIFSAIISYSPMISSRINVQLLNAIMIISPFFILGCLYIFLGLSCYVLKKSE